MGKQGLRLVCCLGKPRKTEVDGGKAIRPMDPHYNINSVSLGNLVREIALHAREPILNVHLDALTLGSVSSRILPRRLPLAPQANLRPISHPSDSDRCEILP